MKLERELEIKAFLLQEETERSLRHPVCMIGGCSEVKCMYGVECRGCRAMSNIKEVFYVIKKNNLKKSLNLKLSFEYENIEKLIRYGSIFKKFAHR